MMRLLVVTHYYPSHRGGVEIVAGELVKRLADGYGIQIEWAASDVNPAPASNTKISYLSMKAVNFLESALGLPYPIWGLGSLNKLREAVKKADVLHLHDYLYMGNLVAFIFAKFYRKPLVITQHTAYRSYKNFILRAIIFTLNKTIGRFVIGHADKAIFISEAIKDYFCGRGSAKNAVFIPNGVDTNVFFPMDEQRRLAIRSELGLRDSKPVFLFVGRFVEKKGLGILHKLASKFLSVHWLFAGWGSLDPELWKLPNVKVFRNRNAVQLALLYQAADLLVLPSIGEGFPLVVQEAMACGTPVLVGTETTRASSAAAPLMFSEDTQGKDISKKWYEKIEGLLQNRSRLCDLRPRVAEFSRHHWDWQNCAAEYKKILCGE